MSLPALAKSPDNVTLAERVNVLIRAYNQTLRIAQELVSETGAVATGTTQIPIDDTIPQNTEGDQYLSLAITPTNALSTLIIDVVAYLASSVAPIGMTAALFRDSMANALAAAALTLPTAGYVLPVIFRHSMVAGTTSATTFKVRAGGGGASTTTFNGSGGARLLGGVYASSITIRERLPAS